MGLLLEHVQVLTSLGILAASLALGLLARGVLLRRLGELAARSPWGADDALVESLRRPLPLWFLLGGLYAVAQTVELPPDLEAIEAKLFTAILVVSLTLWLADVSLRLLLPALARSGGHAAPVAGVVQLVVRGTVLALGGLVLLGTFGISVTPVLTTVGVGGIAVALGLQDTLANLFAGVQITLAGNLRVGDFVKLESGEEGYIDDIRWRATRIRVLANNSVVVPNGRLAQSIITNYHTPSPDLAVLVEVGVHYASDLDRVETVTREVAREVLRATPGAVADFDPFIRYHSFGGSSIDFTVILRAREFTDSYLLKHEFVKALSKRYAAERIVIPFPIRALDLEQQGAARWLGR